MESESQSPLRVEHFDFFTADERDPAVRDAIREALEQLWEMMRVRLSPSDASSLGEIYAGPIPGTGMSGWAQTRREQGQEAVNLTIEIDADEAHLNIVGWTKPQADLLAKWLRSPNARLFWQENSDFELLVFNRQAHTSGPKPVWQGARGVLLERKTAEAVLGEGFASIRSRLRMPLDKHSEHLAFHVRRAWSRGDALGDHDDFVEELAARVPIALQIPPQANEASYFG